MWTTLPRAHNNYTSEIYKNNIFYIISVSSELSTTHTAGAAVTILTTVKGIY